MLSYRQRYSTAVINLIKNNLVNFFNDSINKRNTSCFYFNKILFVSSILLLNKQSCFQLDCCWLMLLNQYHFFSCTIILTVSTLLEYGKRDDINCTVHWNLTSFRFLYSIRYHLEEGSLSS